jgi:hypothetical protein
MKEATGELNMTLVTIIAIAFIAGVVAIFAPQIMDDITNNWDKAGNDDYNKPADYGK